MTAMIKALVIRALFNNSIKNMVHGFPLFWGEQVVLSFVVLVFIVIVAIFKLTAFDRFIMIL